MKNCLLLISALFLLTVPVACGGKAQPASAVAYEDDVSLEEVRASRASAATDDADTE